MKKTIFFGLGVIALTTLCGVAAISSSLGNQYKQTNAVSNLDITIDFKNDSDINVSDFNSDSYDYDINGSFTLVNIYFGSYTDLVASKIYTQYVANQGLTLRAYIDSLQTYLTLYNNGAWNSAHLNDIINQYINCYSLDDSNSTDAYGFIFNNFFSIAGGDYVNLPSQGVNLNNLVGGSSPVFDNSTLLFHDQDKYYIFNGLAYDSVGNLITDIYYKIDYADNLGVSVNGSYYYLKNEGTRGKYAYVKSLYYKGYTPNGVSFDTPVIIHNGETWHEYAISDSATGVVRTIYASYRYNFYITDPYKLFIVYFNIDFDLYNFGNNDIVIDINKPYLAIFSLLSNNPVDFVYQSYIDNNTGVVDLSASFGLLAMAFSSLAGLLSINIFPGISLGLLLFLPLISGIIIAIIWIVKR